MLRTWKKDISKVKWIYASYQLVDSLTDSGASTNALWDTSSGLVIWEKASWITEIKI